MFLISLIIFPFLANYLFSKYKNEVKELNGVIKIIGIIGLSFIILLLHLGIFNNREEYFIIVIIWYVLIFIYNYFLYISLQLKELNKLKFNNFSFLRGIIKIFFLILIFILYINLMEDSDVTNKLYIFRYNSDGVLNSFLLFLWNILLFGILYEVMDTIKNNILKIIKINKDSLINRKNNIEKLKQELKEELKQEILRELKK